MERDQNLNFLWLRCLVEEVLQSGADTAVVSPGGRALALCLELRHNALVKHVVPHTDERSGAFLALGIARTSGQPVIIATTSGSAVANLMPALMEAAALRIPLIVLTCDRLRTFRQSGCGQMADHIGICRSVAAVSLDLSDPVGEEVAILEMRRQVSSAVARSVDPGSRGIVHINIPLEGYNDTTALAEGWCVPSLSPLAMHGRVTASGRRLPMVPIGAGGATYTATGDIVRAMKLRPGLRGLIVAGPECPLSLQLLAEFAKKVGYPVVADMASGLRRPELPNVLSGFDALALKPGIRKHHPELIVRLGLPPVLPVVEHYLLEYQCPTIRISSHMVEKDYLHNAFEVLVRPDEDELAELAAALAPGDTDWLNDWLKIAARGTILRRGRIAESGWGEVAATYVICNSAGFDFLHLGNSMAIRSADVCAEAVGTHQAVYSNRGMNGIDGTIGTFIGELIGTGGTGLLLVGDQAFLHDLPALAAAQNSTINGCICVINNDGGAIFDFLPAAQLPGYIDTIRSIGNIEIEGAARCFRLPYHRCESKDQLVAALGCCSTTAGLHIIEVWVPPRSLVEDMLSLYDVLEADHVENCG